MTPPKIFLSDEILKQIEYHGEKTYPDEGAGFLLGVDQISRVVTNVLPLKNSREDAARHNRYLITPDDYMKAEELAEHQGLDIVGVFHSHPDHPSRPSAFDREWALPHFSYLITSVQAGNARKTRSWRLKEDRTAFEEEKIEILKLPKQL